MRIESRIADRIEDSDIGTVGLVHDDIWDVDEFGSDTMPLVEITIGDVRALVDARDLERFLRAVRA